MYILNPPPNHKLIGHRGTAGLRPENTYCGFKHAAELGLNWVEFDVQLSKDNQWMVMHDDTIDRTTNGHGTIAQYTAEELKKLEAGLWYQPPYPNEPIPTLIDTMELCNTFGLQANIEIKNSKASPQRHAELMYQFIKSDLKLYATAPLLSSFEHECLVWLRQLLPDYPIAYLVEEFAPNTISICKQHNFTTINCSYRKITAQDLSAATKENIPVLLYTVNDRATAQHWFNAGVQAVFTDRADLLLG